MKRVIIHIVFSLPSSKLSILSRTLDNLERKGVWVIKEWVVEER